VLRAFIKDELNAHFANPSPANLARMDATMSNT